MQYAVFKKFLLPMSKTHGITITLNTKMFLNEASWTSIKIIFTQVLWSIQWPCLQVQCFIKTHSDWRFSYSLDHYFYIRLTTGSSFFHDLNNKHTTGREFLLFLAIGTWSHLYCNGGPCLLKVCILTVTNKANH